MSAQSRRSLPPLTIKTLHTLVWAFVVGSIAAVPISAGAQRFDWALGCAGIGLVEVVVLAFNCMQCPLTAIGARYPSDRRPNFDSWPWRGGWARLTRSSRGRMASVGIASDRHPA